MATAKKKSGISIADTDRFTSGGVGMKGAKPTPEHQKRIDKVNAELAAARKKKK